MKRGRHGSWVVLLCAVLSLLLTIVPLPAFLDWVRPVFPLLVVIYWSVVLPDRYGTWSAWFFGLFFDVLRATPLGMHALAFAVAGFAASQLTARMKVYPMLQQIIVVGLLAGVAMIVVRVTGNLTGTTTSALLPALLPVLATALVWPWAMAIQDRLRRVFAVH